MKKLILVLVALWGLGTVCCSTGPVHHTGLPTRLQPDSRRIQRVFFSDSLLHDLEKEWLTSEKEWKERGGCLLGRVEGRNLYVEQALPALLNFRANEHRVYIVYDPRCVGKRRLGSYHTHIAGGVYNHLFSPTDTNSRFEEMDVFHVVVTGANALYVNLTWQLSTGYVEYVSFQKGAQ